MKKHHIIIVILVIISAIALLSFFNMQDIAQLEEIEQGLPVTPVVAEDAPAL